MHHRGVNLLMNNALGDNRAHCLWNSIYGCHNDQLLHNDLTYCALTVHTALFSNLKSSIKEKQLKMENVALLHGFICVTACV